MGIKYDYGIVGAGISGLILARELTNYGYNVLIVEKNKEIGGNCKVHKEYNQTVSSCGIHVWHTKNKRLHEYIQRYTTVRPFTLQAVALRSVGKIARLYSLPINLQTLYQFLGITSVQEAEQYFQDVQSDTYAHTHVDDPDTVAGWCQRTIGAALYELLIKEQIEKHWGRPAHTLHKRIIQRIPYRSTWNNRYFDTYEYEGMLDYPLLFENLSKGIDVITNYDYLADRHGINTIVRRIIYTGSLDAYYDYSFGTLPYRTLSFTYEKSEIHQQAAMVLYPQKEIPYTRSIDYGMLFPEGNNYTVIGKEYPHEWQKDSIYDRMYPIDDEQSRAMYQQYEQRAKADKLLYTGRLGRYQYMNQDQAVAASLKLAEDILHGL